MLSSKALAIQTTVSDDELFTIRLYIMKTTSIDIKYVILITDSLNSTSKAVGSDLFVHSKQAYFLDHSCSLDYKIKF